MSERCLSCRCGATGGAPICRLQVCPQLPVPPPRDCILVHRRNECCQLAATAGRFMPLTRPSMSVAAHLTVCFMHCPAPRKPVQPHDAHTDNVSHHYTRKNNNN
ncbi:hypothetical protein B566_EDAN012009 [Ephemera danica]|nr:hypothetical protein B566_EDAN012009 [Ephemera danica]